MRLVVAHVSSLSYLNLICFYHFVQTLCADTFHCVAAVHGNIITCKLYQQLCNPCRKFLTLVMSMYTEIYTGLSAVIVKNNISCL